MNYLEMLKLSWKKFNNNSNGEKILVCDENTAFDSTNEMKIDEANKYKVHLNLIPQPIMGNIKTAKIVFCSLNPGYDIADYYMQDRALSLKNNVPFYKNQLIDFMNQDLENNFLFLKEEKDESAVGIWWKSKFDSMIQNKSLLSRIQNEYYKNNIIIFKDEIYKMLSKIICTIELFPYHSKSFDKKCLLKLDSVRLAREFVHNELIPNAEKNNQLICFTRSINEWNLTDSEKSNSFVNINKVNVQNITFNPNFDFGKRILEHIRKLTNNFTIII